MRRCAGVGRNPEVVAERRAQCGLVACLDGDGIDQWRPQVVFVDAQQLGQSVRFGAQAHGLGFELTQTRTGVFLVAGGLGAARFGPLGLSLCCGQCQRHRRGPGLAFGSCRAGFAAQLGEPLGQPRRACGKVANLIGQRVPAHFIDGMAFGQGLQRRFGGPYLTGEFRCFGLGLAAGVGFVVAGEPERVDFGYETRDVGLGFLRLRLFAFGIGVDLRDPGPELRHLFAGL